MIKYFFIIMLCFSSFAELSLIPKPFKVERSKGAYTAKSTLTFSLSKELKNEAKYFMQELYKRRGIKAKYAKNAQVRLSIANTPKLKELGKDGYTLTVNNKGIAIQSTTATGVFNGIQTLFQLIPSKSTSSFKIPYVKIEDKPRFSWRAAHLDVSRHFYTVDTVKRYIDFMAMHKMNIFHWHLTDHQGWRVQIDSWPKLTSVGAWRRITDMNTLRAKSFDETVEQAKARLIKEGRYKDIDGVGYFGGFYTKKDMKDIIAYASERHIDVIPEIDIPGHTQAVIAAYPELKCSSATKDYEVCTWMGLNNAIICPSRPETTKFLDDVFREVLEIFPTKFIHIGADESHGGMNQFWKTCEYSKKHLKDLGSTDVHDLQIEVIKHVHKIIKKADRRMVVWGEAFHNGMDKDVIVMSWWGTGAGEKAARHGNQVVMTPHSHLYFNSKTYRDQTYHEVNKPIEQIYKYDPAPMKYTEQMRKNIIGSQPCLWSEFVPTRSDLEFRTMPNNIVAAEMAWTMQDQRELGNFMSRLNRHYPRLDKYNVRYYVAEPKEAQKVFFNSEIKTNITSAFPNAKIVYRKKGETELKPYKNGMIINEATDLETYAFAPSGLRSVLNKIKYQKIDLKPSNAKPTKFGFKVTKYELPGRDFKIHSDKKQDETTHVGFSVPSKYKGQDRFALLYKGFFKVQKGKSYTFELNGADDGLVINFLGQKELLNNRNRMLKTVRFALKPGYYPIEMKFFEIGGAETIDLKIYDETGAEVKDIASLIFH